MAAAEYNTTPKDYYKVLEVDYDATDENIKLNYRRLALKWHPDKHKGDSAVTAKFQEINEAYNVLSDPAKRFDYDLTGACEIEKYSLQEYLARFKGMILTCNGLGINHKDRWNPMPPRREIPTARTENPEMDRVIQVMADMAAAVAQQTATMTQRDLQQQQRAKQNTEARGLVDFRKHDPPRFHGEPNPEKANLWLQEVEKIFEVLHCPEHVKVSYTSYLLGNAEYWWKGVKQMLAAEHQEANWETFRGRFLDKYFPESARIEEEQEFLRLYQGNMTVSKYAAKFQSLAKYFRFFRDQVDERWMSEKFEHGLRYDVKKSVLPLDIRQFQQLVEKCTG